VVVIVIGSLKGLKADHDHDATYHSLFSEHNPVVERLPGEHDHIRVVQDI